MRKGWPIPEHPFPAAVSGPASRLLIMSDGATLWTIVVNPAPAGSRRGSVICRSPYGPTSNNLADVFVATNGYVAVLQDGRGTWRSNGTFDLWQQAASDNADTVRWIEQQPWSNAVGARAAVMQLQRRAQPCRRHPAGLLGGHLPDIRERKAGDRHRLSRAQ